MADALTMLERLEKAHKFLDGGKSVYDNAKKVRDAAKIDPKDIAALEKLLGLQDKKLAKLGRHFEKMRKDVEAAASAGFPAVPDPTERARKELAEAEKKHGADSPQFDKKFDAYLKLVTEYERSLHERSSYMALIVKKCEANQKNYTAVNEAIESTLTLLHVAIAGFPTESATAMAHYLNIEKTIRNRPRGVALAYRKLRDAAAGHKRWVDVDRAHAKAVLDGLWKMKGKALIEDAASWLKKLVG